VFVALGPVLAACLVGCGSKFFDPTQLGRFRPTPAVNVILDSLGVAEETPSAWEGAEEPRPVDLITIETDHVFSPGDTLAISIFELFREGEPFVIQVPVTETGRISIPEVGTIHAAGLTESQLEEEIRDILHPDIIVEPSVVVILTSSERRAFSVLGNGVSFPGRYFVPRYGFRLADALAAARGISEFNVSNIYISRAITGQEAELPPFEPEATEPKTRRIPQEQMLEIIVPHVLNPVLGPGKTNLNPDRYLENSVVIASAELATPQELSRTNSKTASDLTADQALPWSKAGNEERPAKTTADARTQVPSSAKVPETLTMDQSPNPQNSPDQIEWIFQDGRWVPVRTGRLQVTEPAVELRPQIPVEPLEDRVPADFGWEQIGTGGVQTRVIRIPVDRFQSGDPRYNIVIKPGDTIYVPVDIIGECYIMGNVARQGAITLTGRPITLKIAIALAGGLGPLGWPKRCEVIRRLGTSKEEIIMVDLDKIASGEQPDFYIKINDLINVGTHPTARWRAVLRNAFRATYGFGFVYDRNYADRDFGTSRPFGSVF
jgi:protein involved in polysaccharide export with SLBB domain